jgi:hypothetical protein
MSKFFVVIDQEVDRGPGYPLVMTAISALKLSIKKWQFIVKWKEAHRGQLLRDGGTTTCACCRKYFHQEPSCFGCPIKNYTGFSACGYTPYTEYEATHKIGDARAEVEFLKSVLKQLRKDIRDEETSERD